MRCFLLRAQAYFLRPLCTSSASFETVSYASKIWAKGIQVDIMIYEGIPVTAPIGQWDQYAHGIYRRPPPSGPVPSHDS